MTCGLQKRPPSGRDDAGEDLEAGEDPVADEGAVELALKGVGRLGEEPFNECEAFLKLLQRDEALRWVEGEVDDLSLRKRQDEPADGELTPRRRDRGAFLDLLPREIGNERPGVDRNARGLKADEGLGVQDGVHPLPGIS